jgi:hypothetical protein
VKNIDSSEAENPYSRNIIDELIAKKPDTLAETELGQVGEEVVEASHLYPQANSSARNLFGHLPDPVRATTVFKPTEAEDSAWLRDFTGTCRRVASKNNIFIDIRGFQHSNGTVERYLHVFIDDRDDPDGFGNLFLSAAEVRDLASTLN